MNQLPADLADKLDAPLAQLCNGESGVTPSTWYPVLVRCENDTLSIVAHRVEQLGGKVRRQLALISAIAAWVPLSQIERLARDSNVSALELEQSFTTA